MTPQEAYDELCRQWLTKPRVTIGRALSRQGLMVGGKLFAFLWGDMLVVKLPATRVDELTAEGTAARMVMGSRPMKQWAEVHDSASWPALADEAYAFVASG